MTSHTAIKPLQLFQQIGTPCAPAIIDVSIDADFTADPRLIPAAKRYPFESIENLAPALAAQKVVLVCQKGLKLSMGGASILRSLGIAATHLDGGNFAWRDAGLPLIPAEIIPDPDWLETSFWVTGNAPGLDRMTCCWLVRRFIDPRARILFVQESQIINVAEKYKATPFDADGAAWRKHSNFSTFGTMLDTLCLDTASLRRLAQMTGLSENGETGCEYPGDILQTLMSGLSATHECEQAALRSGIVVMDALYQQARNNCNDEFIVVDNAGNQANA